MEENMEKTEVEINQETVNEANTNNQASVNVEEKINNNQEEAKEGEVVGEDGFSKKDKDENKAMAILSYIGILSLIPYITEKKSKWVRYNAIQGLNIFIVSLIGSVVGIIPVLGWIASGVISIFTFVISIMGIVNVCNGEAKELPLMNNFKFIKE